MSFNHLDPGLITGGVGVWAKASSENSVDAEAGQGLNGRYTGATHCRSSLIWDNIHPFYSTVLYVYYGEGGTPPKHWRDHVI
ncbi:MAG: hypothetical protein QMD10_10825 [Desulfitobacteriaceae bacterium]|nr:hypothetical protein [Desulfitobacteriaceae bacterium]